MCVCLNMSAAYKNVGVCQIQLNECHDKMHPTLTHLAKNCLMTRENVLATKASRYIRQNVHNPRMQAQKENVSKQPRWQCFRMCCMSSIFQRNDDKIREEDAK